MCQNRIVPVTRADLDAVYQVFCTAAPDSTYAEETGFLLSQYNIEAFWAFLKTRTAYLAQKNDTIVGYVVIARPTPDQMEPIRWFDGPIVDESDGRLLWIKMVAVLPVYKRQGVASALYRHLFQTHPHVAFITGLYEYPLPNRASSAFHLALGFQRVGVIERIETNNVAQRVTGIFYKTSRSR